MSADARSYNRGTFPPIIKPFVSGTRFGAFEILERGGTGGMGEVYRARETRLDRTVALKVIRASELAGRDCVDLNLGSSSTVRSDHASRIWRLHL